ncbi:MAG: hypothetical protein HRU03_07340 [Nanoarchaeales archaeon]|nr:hypothetical protein [Nanoarchaeales archaeon]
MKTSVHNLEFNLNSYESDSLINETNHLPILNYSDITKLTIPHEMAFISTTRKNSNDSEGDFVPIYGIVRQNSISFLIYSNPNSDNPKEKLSINLSSFDGTYGTMSRFQ